MNSKYLKGFRRIIAAVVSLSLIVPSPAYALRFPSLKTETPGTQKNRAELRQDLEGLGIKVLPSEMRQPPADRSLQIADVSGRKVSVPVRPSASAPVSEQSASMQAHRFTDPRAHAKRSVPPAKNLGDGLVRQAHHHPEQSRGAERSRRAEVREISASVRQSASEPEFEQLASVQAHGFTGSRANSERSEVRQPNPDHSLWSYGSIDPEGSQIGKTGGLSRRKAIFRIATATAFAAVSSGFPLSAPAGIERVVYDEKELKEHLKDLIDQLNNPQSHADVIDQMMKIPDPIGALLLEALEARKEINVRIGLLKTLGRLGETRAMSYAEQFLEGFPSTDMKTNQHFKEAGEEYFRILGARAISGFLRMLKSSKEETAFFAVNQLGQFDRPELINPLVDVFLDPGIFPRIRGIAALILGEKGKENQAEFLTDLFLKEAPSADEYLLEYILRALGEIGSPRAADFLLATAQSAHLQARKVALTQLQWISDPRIGPALIDTLERLPLTEIEYRAGIMQVLGARKVKQALPRLLLSLKENDLVIRKNALQALCQIQEPSSGEVLYQEFSTIAPTTAENIELLKILGIALGKMKIKKAFSKMVQLLDRDPENFCNFFSPLVEFDALGAFPVLEKAARNLWVNLYAKESAILALGRIPDERALKLLLTLLRYRSVKEMKVVRDALSLLPKEIISKVVLQIFDSQLHDVALKALQIIHHKDEGLVLNEIIELLQKRKSENGLKSKEAEGLKLLEQCRTLEIFHPFRYGFGAKGFSLLKELIRNRVRAHPDRRPLAICIYPTNDWNGAFSNTQSLEALISAGYRVMFYEASTVHDVIRSIQEAAKGQKASVVVVGGHGNPHAISLGAEDPRITEVTDRERDHQISLRHREILIQSGIGSLLEDGGHIILESCSTGQGRDKSLNIANMFRDIFRRAAAIWSPVNSTSINKLQFDKKKKIQRVIYDDAEPEYRAFLDLHLFQPIRSLVGPLLASLSTDQHNRSEVREKAVHSTKSSVLRVPVASVPESEQLANIQAHRFTGPRVNSERSEVREISVPVRPSASAPVSEQSASIQAHGLTGPRANSKRSVPPAKNQGDGTRRRAEVRQPGWAGKTDGSPLEEAAEVRTAVSRRIQFRSVRGSESVLMPERANTAVVLNQVIFFGKDYDAVLSFGPRGPRGLRASLTYSDSAQRGVSMRLKASWPGHPQVSSFEVHGQKVNIEWIRSRRNPYAKFFNIDAGNLPYIVGHSYEQDSLRDAARTQRAEVRSDSSIVQRAASLSEELKGVQWWTWDQLSEMQKAFPDPYIKQRVRRVDLKLKQPNPRDQGAPEVENKVMLRWAKNRKQMTLISDIQVPVENRESDRDHWRKRIYLRLNPNSHRFSHLWRYKTYEPKVEEGHFRGLSSDQLEAIGINREKQEFYLRFHLSGTPQEQQIQLLNLRLLANDEIFGAGHLTAIVTAGGVGPQEILPLKGSKVLSIKREYLREFLRNDSDAIYKDMEVFRPRAEVRGFDDLVDEGPLWSSVKSSGVEAGGIIDTTAETGAADEAAKRTGNFRRVRDESMPTFYGSLLRQDEYLNRSEVRLKVATSSVAAHAMSITGLTAGTDDFYVVSSGAIEKGMIPVGGALKLSMIAIASRSELREAIQHYNLYLRPDGAPEVLMAESARQAVDMARSEIRRLQAAGKISFRAKTFGLIMDLTTVDADELRRILPDAYVNILEPMLERMAGIVGMVSQKLAEWRAQFKAVSASA